MPRLRYFTFVRPLRYDALYTLHTIALLRTLPRFTLLRCRCCAVDLCAWPIAPDPCPHPDATLVPRTRRDAVAPGLRTRCNSCARVALPALRVTLRLYTFVVGCLGSCHTYVYYRLPDCCLYICSCPSLIAVTALTLPLRWVRSTRPFVWPHCITAYGYYPIYSPLPAVGGFIRSRYYDWFICCTLPAYGPLDYLHYLWVSYLVAVVVSPSPTLPHLFPCLTL